MSTPDVVKRAIAGFRYERVFSLNWEETMQYLNAVETVLIPDAPADERVTHWLDRAEQASRLGADPLTVRRHITEAAQRFFALQHLAETEFRERLGATALFGLRQAVMSEDATHFEEAARRLISFIVVFEPTPVLSSIERVMRGERVRSPLIVNPTLVLAEARKRAQNGDLELAERCLRTLDIALTSLIDEAIARDWRPPDPYGVILMR